MNNSHFVKFESNGFKWGTFFNLKPAQKIETIIKRIVDERQSTFGLSTTVLDIISDMSDIAEVKSIYTDDEQLEDDIED